MNLSLITLLGRLVACLLFVATVLPGFAATKPPRSRFFNGVTASFEIKNPIVRLGEELKVVVGYRNGSNRTVRFRFSHLDFEAELYKKGKRKAIIGGYVGEAPYREISLSPGETFRTEDVFSLNGWPTCSPAITRFSLGTTLAC